METVRWASPTMKDGPAARGCAGRRRRAHGWPVLWLWSAQRSLADELVGRLVGDGLLRTGVPRSVGGPTAPPSVTLRAAEAVARGDASAGWCVSIAMTSSLLSGYLPQKGADEVFGDRRSTASGVWAPTAQARPMRGGATVSGRWSSGSPDRVPANRALTAHEAALQRPGNPIVLASARRQQGCGDSRTSW